MLLNKRSFEFGEFHLQADEKILLHEGEPVSLTPKAVQLLLVLVENHGHVVSKEELMQAVWADSFVEESNLTFTVSLLRKALGDTDKRNLRFIETVPKRGYRFIADVREIQEENETPIQNSDSHKPKKYLIPAAMLGVLLTGLVTVAWYAKSRSLSKTAPILSEPFSLEKISTDGKATGVAISPDGKTVIYSSEISSDKQSIWLRRLDSGTNVELIPPANYNHHSFVFSPDGTFIYFNRRLSSANDVPDIYRISIFGGVPQKIIEGSYSQIGLSPDGTRISFIRCQRAENNYCAVWIANANDGSDERQIAVSTKPNRITSPTFSPDGKSVVYAVGQSNNAANEFGLVELELETGVNREFTAEKFFDIKKIAWLPDKSGLLITASRIPNRNFRLWFVSDVETTPLTKDSESYHMLSLDKAAASIAATQVKPDFQLKLFQIADPPSSGSVLANASSASFAVNDKILLSSAMTGNEEIWSIQKDGTDKRQLTNTPADETTPIISRDGKVIFFTSNRTGEAQIWRMNSDGTNQVQITQKEGGFPVALSPDGKRLYYRSGTKKNLWMVSTEDGGGSGEQLVADRKSFTAAFSPDGLQAAYSNTQNEKGIIEIYSLSDWQILKTYSLPEGKIEATQLIWSVDGKSLFYLVGDKEYKNNALWQQNLDSKTPRKIADLGDELIETLAISPDGKSFTIVQGRWRHDAVLLKGLK